MVPCTSRSVYVLPKTFLHSAVITFDQPLWLKALDIAVATGLDIVCHLGGFYIIKSFLGAIVTVMAGSGLEELLGTVNTEHVTSLCYVTYLLVCLAWESVEDLCCLLSLHLVCAYSFTFYYTKFMLT